MTSFLPGFTRKQSRMRRPCGERDGICCSAGRSTLARPVVVDVTL
jgi:hypothetical protein